MNYELTTTLLSLGYHVALAVWILLTFFLIFGISKRRSDIIKRVSKYFINSSVFLIAYFFYLDLALIVRPPVLELQLKAWISEHVVGYIYVSIVAVLMLCGINLLFYKKFEKHKYKADLFILAAFDIFVLSCGAWLAGQDAYFGLLQEINRNR